MELPPEPLLMMVMVMETGILLLSVTCKAAWLWPKMAYARVAKRQG